MLSGSSALVTGATGRIGLAIGLALREARMEVLLHGRNPGRVALLQEEMGTEAMAGDLTRPEAVEAIITRIARHGRLSVLTLGSRIASARMIRRCWSGCSRSISSGHMRCYARCCPS